MNTIPAGRMPRAEYERRLDAWDASQKVSILWVVIGIGALCIWGVPLAAVAGLLPRRAVLPAVVVGGLVTLGWPLLIISRVNRRKAKAGLVCPECAASLLGTATREAVTPAGDCVRCGAALLEPTPEVRALDERVAAAGTPLPSRGEFEPRLRAAAATASTRMGIAMGGMTAVMASPLVLLSVDVPVAAAALAPLVGMALLVAAMKSRGASLDLRERAMGVFCPGCDEPLVYGGICTLLRTGRCTQCGQRVMRTVPGDRAGTRTTPDRGERHVLWILLLMMATLAARGFAPRGEEGSMLRSESMVLVPLALLLAWAGARLLASGWWKDATPTGRWGVLSFPALMLAFTLLLNAPWINALVPPQRREMVEGRVVRTYLSKGETGRPIVVIQVAGRAEPLELWVRRREFQAMKPGDPFRREMVRGGLGLLYFPR